jgi:hypothetical protein
MGWSTIDIVAPGPTRRGIVIRPVRLVFCVAGQPVELIEVKRAAGRPKDLQAIADLEALLEERGTKSAIVQEGKVGGRAGSHVYSPATRSQD